MNVPVEKSRVNETVSQVKVDVANNGNTEGPQDQAENLVGRIKILVAAEPSRLIAVEKCSFSEGPLNHPKESEKHIVNDP
jgi:hypothetical protein